MKKGKDIFTLKNALILIACIVAGMVLAPYATELLKPATETVAPVASLLM